MPNFIILVVEDEDAIREMLIVVLEQAGFKNVCAIEIQQNTLGYIK